MLLLASASPARRRLLEQAAIPHRVQASDVDEQALREADPRRLVQRLAEAKARAVLDRLQPSDTAVLGCDSLLVVEGEVFGKPADAAEARQRWRRMAGGWGDLLTGHCLLPVYGRGADAVEPALAVVSTRLWFASISAATIDTYVASGEPLQCAGGFALEGRGGALIERIDGCVSNVIGLSLPLLRRWLEAQQSLSPDPARPA